MARAPSNAAALRAVEGVELLTRPSRMSRWFEDFNLIAKIGDLTDAQKRLLLPRFLGGRFKTWYQTDGFTITEYIPLRHAMECYFADESTHPHLWREYDECRRQRNPREPIRNFVLRFRACYSDYNNTIRLVQSKHIISDQQAALDFCYHLDDDTSYDVLDKLDKDAAQPITLQRACELAIQNDAWRWYFRRERRNGAEQYEIDNESSKSTGSAGPATSLTSKAEMALNLGDLFNKFEEKISSHYDKRIGRLEERIHQQDEKIRLLAAQAQSAQPPQHAQQWSADRPRPTCHNCGRVGHSISVCYRPCGQCGSRVHKMPDCSTLPPAPQTTNAVVDSNAQREHQPYIPPRRQHHPEPPLDKLAEAAKTKSPESHYDEFGRLNCHGQKIMLAQVGFSPPIGKMLVDEEWDQYADSEVSCDDDRILVGKSTTSLKRGEQHLAAGEYSLTSEQVLSGATITLTLAELIEVAPSLVPGIRKELTIMSDREDGTEAKHRERRKRTPE